MRTRIEELGIELPNASHIYDAGLVSYLEYALVASHSPRIVNRIRIQEALNGFTQ